VLADREFRYGAGDYLVASVGLPVTGAITRATPREPFLVLVLHLDPATIAGLVLHSALEPAPPVSDRGLAVSRAAPPGVGRRIIRQRSSGTPSDGGSTRNQPSSWGPKSSTPHTSAQPSPHQRATAAASSSSRQPPSGNTSRTWAARPDRVSRASTGPAGREAIPAELAR